MGGSDGYSEADLEAMADQVEAGAANLRAAKLRIDFLYPALGVTEAEKVAILREVLGLEGQKPKPIHIPTFVARLRQS